MYLHMMRYFNTKRESNSTPLEEFLPFQRLIFGSVYVELKARNGFVCMNQGGAVI